MSCKRELQIRGDGTATLVNYPELLDWRDLETVFGRCRRTLKRQRALGKLRGITFSDVLGTGLQATRESVERFISHRVVQERVGTLSEVG